MNHQGWGWSQSPSALPAQCLGSLALRLLDSILSWTMLWTVDKTSRDQRSGSEQLKWWRYISAVVRSHQQGITQQVFSKVSWNNGKQQLQVDIEFKVLWLFIWLQAPPLFIDFKYNPSQEPPDSCCFSNFEVGRLKIQFLFLCSFADKFFLQIIAIWRQCLLVKSSSSRTL